MTSALCTISGPSSRSPHLLTTIKVRSKVDAVIGHDDVAGHDVVGVRPLRDGLIRVCSLITPYYCIIKCQCCCLVIGENLFRLVFEVIIYPRLPTPHTLLLQIPNTLKRNPDLNQLLLMPVLSLFLYIQKPFQLVSVQKRKLFLLQIV